jgi:hypothetical protein
MIDSAPFTGVRQNLPAGPNVQVAAPGAPRLPGICFEPETGGFERAPIDFARDATHGHAVLLAQAQFLPSFLQRASRQQKIQAFTVAPCHLRIEQPATIRDEGEKRIPEPLKIVRGKWFELFAYLLATSVDSPLDKFGGRPFANFTPQLGENEEIQDCPVLKRGTQLGAEIVFTHSRSPKR